VERRLTVGWAKGRKVQEGVETITAGVFLEYAKNTREREMSWR